MSDLVGHMLGPYQVLSEIGHGGMSDVYRAIQPSVGREVALKILPVHFLQDRGLLERFNREIKIIARLQHPHILPVYDSGEEDGLPYIVMAYMSGGTLADRIDASTNRMSLKEIVRLVGQIAEALDYAHEQGIIHHDLKPSNILIDRKDNVYLADFGIARVIADTAQSAGSSVFGTPQYMAPELSGGGKITPLVDVYALAVTVYEMVTGQHPYTADTPLDTILAHASQPIPNARKLRPRLPSAVQRVIAWGMAKDPEDRPGSAGELAQLLERAMGHAGPDTANITPPIADRSYLRASLPPPTEEVNVDQDTPIPTELTGSSRPEASHHPKTGQPDRARPDKRHSMLPVIGVVGVTTLFALTAITTIILFGTEPKSAPGATPRALTTRPASLTRVAHNAEWEPVIQTIDGVEMVEAPPGCFRMGNDSGDNEKPSHQQCFDQPFWLDRTEVTNAQFAQFGGEAATLSRWTADNLPRERITWVEAEAFCQKRGVRLPTEAEWEYAARGPDALIYPWGKDFEPANVVFGRNSASQTAEVGSKPGGASWVGAVDMSGNVYEWVNSLFRPYPYRQDDGREGESDRTHTRVARGGSWSISATAPLRASLRSGGDPLSMKDDFGFRCARSD